MLCCALLIFYSYSCPRTTSDAHLPSYVAFLFLPFFLFLFFFFFSFLSFFFFCCFSGFSNRVHPPFSSLCFIFIFLLFFHLSSSDHSLYTTTFHFFALLDFLWAHIFLVALPTLFFLSSKYHWFFLKSLVSFPSITSVHLSIRNCWIVFR